MNFLYFFSIAMYLALCFILSVVVLMQESKSAGLGASFGGDASDSLFGVSTPKILKVITGWLAVAFMSFCLLLSAWTSARGRWHADKYLESSLNQELVSPSEVSPETKKNAKE